MGSVLYHVLVGVDGLTGAANPSYWGPSTATGAPASGTWPKGAAVTTGDGHIFVCTVAGTPGTWVDVSAGAAGVTYGTPAVVLGTAAAAGSIAEAIRRDSTIVAFDATAPTTQAFGDSAVVGTAAFAARRDHKHAMPAAPVTSINKTGSTALTGAVTLTGGTNVTLTQSGQDISIASSSGATVEYPWHVQVIPMIATADATTGTWVLAAFTDNLNFGLVNPGGGGIIGAGSVFNSSGAQNDAWAIDIVLAAGTWDFHVWVRKSSNTAIITLEQDGSSMGTVDTYAAAAAAAKVSVTGWTVSATGKKRMNFKAATKNASSSGYFIEMFGIEFRRTA